MRATACLLLLVIGTSLAADGKPVIGRLFGPAGGRVGQGPPPAATHLRIDGVVFRSSAAGTVWINGSPASAPHSPVRVAALPESKPGYPGLKHWPATARVGETVDLEAARRTDIVPPGAVTVEETP